MFVKSANARPIFQKTIMCLQSYLDLDPEQARSELQAAFNASTDEVFICSNPNIQLTLPSIRPPFLPPKQEEGKKYTLVLDLDETLVHYDGDTGEGRFLVRPGAVDFLTKLGEYYEIVVFTAALQHYADHILDQIDPTHTLIAHRLYRNHTIVQNQIYIKDLSKLGRPLDKIIIIDNLEENFSLQPNNGILIKAWFDDEEDDVLNRLGPILL
jgi:Dullard-like phosphatase family protein